MINQHSEKKIFIEKENLIKDIKDDDNNNNSLINYFQNNNNFNIKIILLKTKI